MSALPRRFRFSFVADNHPGVQYILKCIPSRRSVSPTSPLCPLADEVIE